MFSWIGGYNATALSSEVSPRVGTMRWLPRSLSSEVSPLMGTMRWLPRSEASPLLFILIIVVVRQEELCFLTVAAAVFLQSYCRCCLLCDLLRGYCCHVDCLPPHLVKGVDVPLRHVVGLSLRLPPLW